MRVGGALEKGDSSVGVVEWSGGMMVDAVAHMRRMWGFDEGMKEKVLFSKRSPKRK